MTLPFRGTRPVLEVAAIIRPHNFKPRKKYPVILSVYAGPTATVVHSPARAYLADQWTADQGYVVMHLDGRGTPYRGRDWERIIRGNLIDVALVCSEDYIPALDVCLGATEFQ